MSKSIRLAATAVGLAAAFSAGVILYEQFGAQPAPAAEAPRAANPAVELAGFVRRPAVPDSLPDFTLKDLNGKAHSIREWSGRPLAINFWATWCVPCREEIPLLQRIRREHRGNGVEVVGIAVDFTEDVRKFVAKTPIEYPILVGEDEAARVAALFGVVDLALPFTVFIDRSGRILVLRMGQLHEDQAKLILGALQELDSGRLALPAAKARVAAGLRS